MEYLTFPWLIDFVDDLAVVVVAKPPKDMQLHAGGTNH